ncbi:MAG: hypothetical protein J5819_08760 [Eubacterium sp.]|nr:hypothetical protein [Eubacterium sp.]
MNNESGSISFRYEGLLSPLRYILLITVVISAYDTGRAILSLIELARKPGMDLLLVILWLIAAPLTFATTVCLFYACKRLREGHSPNMPITIGFGLMVLSSVANLISQVNILNGNGLSIVILCGIVLICYVICFLYYQRIGTKLMTWFAAGLNVLCGGYYLINGIKLVVEQPDQLLGYLFTSYATAFLIAVSVLLFTIAVSADHEEMNIMDAD